MNVLLDKYFHQGALTPPTDEIVFSCAESTQLMQNISQLIELFIPRSMGLAIVYKLKSLIHPD